MSPYRRVLLLAELPGPAAAQPGTALPGSHYGRWVRCSASELAVQRTHRPFITQASRPPRRGRAEHRAQQPGRPERLHLADNRPAGPVYWSGKEALLPAPPPLGTVRDTYASYGSGIPVRLSQDA